MEPEKKTILMLGTFDSKGNEFQYLYEELLRRGVAVMTMDVGVFKPQGHFHVDITSEEVAESGGRLLKDIRARGDRGEAMKYMSLGARSIAMSLQKKGIIDAGIAIGISKSMYQYISVWKYTGVCGYKRYSSFSIYC